MKRLKITRWTAAGAAATLALFAGLHLVNDDDEPTVMTPSGPVSVDEWNAHVAEVNQAQDEYCRELAAGGGGAGCVEAP